MLSKRVEERTPNPKETANFLSILTYIYIIPTLLKGYKNDITQKDIPKVLKSMSPERLGDELEEMWIKQRSTIKNVSLMRTILQFFISRYIWVTLMCIGLELSLRVGMSIILLELIYLMENEYSAYEPYLYILGFIGTSLVMTIIRQYQVNRMWTMGVAMKGACLSLIYRKILRLQKSELDKISVGRITSLFSNDIARFDQWMAFMYGILSGPVQVVVSLYILYEYMGPLAMTGLLFLILLTPVQLFLGKLAGYYRRCAAVKTDERIRLINEMITGMQVIKMYAWEKPFAHLIDSVRRLELRNVRCTSYILGIIMSWTSLPKLLTFLTILIYSLTGNKITTAYAFFVASVYNSLGDTMTRFFPRAIIQTAESIVSMNRLQEFLVADERIENYATHKTITKSNLLVDIKNAVPKWNKPCSTGMPTINFHVTHQELLAIIGPVGSGKTTILQVILNETRLVQGSANVSGTVSYASQEPWIFNGTVRENILFGLNLNAQRYSEVLRVSTLERDIETLPYGDETLVGEKGIMLSGGQRARINLARAVYYDADIYLLDNPLAAVDVHVGKHLFEECILNFLANKCRIFVTHQLEYIEKTDRAILIENGGVTLSGTYQELQESGLDFTKMLKQPDAEETPKVSNVKERNHETSEHLKTFSNKSEFKEEQAHGKLNSQVYLNYIKLGKSIFAVVLCLVLHIALQTFLSGGDYLLVYWIKHDNLGEFQSIPRNTFLYAFTGIVLFVIVLGLLKTFSFVQYFTKVSKVLHDKLCCSVINAPLRFFNITPTGRILNRFSKDVDCVDNNIPMFIFESMHLGFMAFGVLVVVSISNIWSLLAAIVVAPLLYFVGMVCVRGAQSLKRVVGISHSPIFCHVSDTLEGLTTIRALKKQEVLLEEFNKHLDFNCAAEQTHLDCNRAFGLYVDAVCLLYGGIVILIFKAMNDDPVSLGLTITQVMVLLTSMQMCMRSYADVDTQMISVERVLEYCNLEPEETTQKQAPAENWPNSGDIKFSSVSLRYSPSDPYVLKDINLEINHKDKIGIVGRTGAGKSSLITALLQLTPTDGKIVIDHVDISIIPLSELRSKIAIIPQQPMLFSGTMRRNLDPFESYSDVELWSALEEVQLKKTVSELGSGLDFHMTGGGADFSVGQKQLICLARAIVSKRRILILDEATASIDPYTDMIIQNTIREKFKDCTVLTIAHRINTIMDSDKVLVMDEGKVVEFDSPQRLLENQLGKFYGMVHQKDS